MRLVDFPIDLLGVIVECATYACPKTLQSIRLTCHALAVTPVPDADATVFLEAVRLSAADCIAHAPALAATD